MRHAFWPRKGAKISHFWPFFAFFAFFAFFRGLLLPQFTSRGCLEDSERLAVRERREKGASSILPTAARERRCRASPLCALPPLLAKGGKQRRRSAMCF